MGIKIYFTDDALVRIDLQSNGKFGPARNNITVDNKHLYTEDQREVVYNRAKKLLSLPNHFRIVLQDENNFYFLSQYEDNLCGRFVTVPKKYVKKIE